jgi:hypothetical protein
MGADKKLHMQDWNILNILFPTAKSEKLVHSSYIYSVANYWRLRDNITYWNWNVLRSMD